MSMCYTKRFVYATVYSIITYLFVITVVKHVTHISFILIWVVGECHEMWGKIIVSIVTYSLIDDN